MAKKSEEMYETFDSSGGPIQKGSGESGSRDSESGLHAEGENAEHGDVPEVPQKKR